MSLTLPQNITEKPYDCFLFNTGILLASNAVVGEDDLWVRVFVLACVCTRIFAASPSLAGKFSQIFKHTKIYYTGKISH